MARHIQRQIDVFDWDRGDVLSIPKEDAVRIVELTEEFGPPVLYQLMRWFIGESESEAKKALSDPRDRAMLAGMIEHQKANARKRGEYLASQGEKSAKAKAKRTAKTDPDTHGTPTGHPRGEVKEEVEVKEEKISVSDKSSLRDHSSPSREGQSATGAATAGVIADAAGVPFNSTVYTRELEKARSDFDSKLKAAIALKEKEGGDWDPLEGDDVQEADARISILESLARNPLETMAELLCEPGNMKTINALKNYVKRLGLGQVIDNVLDVTSSGVVPWEEYGKTLFGRLNKLKDINIPRRD